MAYLPNCQNGTACFALYGGLTGGGTTLLGDTNVWWPSSSGAASSQLCGTAADGTILTLTCPAGQYISYVGFTSYGESDLML